MSVRERLRKYAEINPLTGCHELNLRRDRDGYCLISYQGMTQRAHRVAYRLHHGELPNHHGVFHRCDTRNCVNPAHLWAGTHPENMSDMKQKGRASRCPKPAYALSPDQVRFIRASSEPNRRLARDLGVDPNTIRRVRSGKSYPDLI